MKRLSTALLGAIAATALLPAIAPAAFAAGEVVLRSGLPTDWNTVSGDCTVSTDGGGNFAHVNGPGTPPLGTGSLRMTAPAQEVVGFYRPEAVAASALQDFAFGYDQVSGDAAPPTGQLFLDEDGNQQTAERVMYFGGAAGAGWHNATLANDPLVSYDMTATTPQAENTTWSAYRSAHTSAQVIQALVMAGCGTNTTVANIDALRWSTTSATTTYDFEAPPAATLKGSLSATAINLGQAVSIKGTMTSNGAPLAGQQVELWKKAWNQSTFTKLTTVTTSSTGAFSSTQKPIGRTTYQWRLPTGSLYSAPAVTAGTVAVRATMTIHVQDTTVTRSQTIYVWGLTQTKLAGTTVPLMRTGSTTALATARVQSDGTYALTKRITTAGSYTLYVADPGSAASGLSAGRSAGVGVKVS
jgi:hypothetical protein